MTIVRISDEVRLSKKYLLESKRLAFNELVGKVTEIPTPDTAKVHWQNKETTTEFIRNLVKAKGYSTY